jgi:hypothetical protein
MTWRPLKKATAFFLRPEPENNSKDHSPSYRLRVLANEFFVFDRLKVRIEFLLKDLLMLDRRRPVHMVADCKNDISAILVEAHDVDCSRIINGDKTS